MTEKKETKKRETKREMVIKKFETLLQRFIENERAERYEFMERPEISVICKARETAFQYAAVMVHRALLEIKGEWPAPEKEISCCKPPTTANRRRK